MPNIQIIRNSCQIISEKENNNTNTALNCGCKHLTYAQTAVCSLFIEAKFLEISSNFGTTISPVNLPLYLFDTCSDEILYLDGMANFWPT